MGAIILVLVLGYCFYTDVWCGMIIPNEVSVALIIAAAAAPPLLYSHSWHLYVGAIVCLLVLLAGSYAGWIGMGDAKILVALTLLMGRGVVAVIVVASLLGLLYGIPARIYHQLTGRFRSHTDDGKRVLYEFPFGPAIAVAVPVVFGVGDLDVVKTAALVVLELACAVFFWRCSAPIKRWWDSIDEEVQKLEGQAELGERA